LLAEQKKLLSRKDAAEFLTEVITLNELAASVQDEIRNGVHRTKSIDKFLTASRKFERDLDERSVELWKYVPVSISGIFESIQRSSGPDPRKDQRLHNDLCSSYHNLRLRLLGQILGARMLDSNSDLGEEVELVWLQFFQRQLGSRFKVIKGGKILDHEGNRSPNQIDLLVVRDGAPIVEASDTDGGKGHVFIDQVIAAIMITSNLTPQKLAEDWEKLSKLPKYESSGKDFPRFRKHPFPLTYIVSGSTPSIEKLEKKWEELTGSEEDYAPQGLLALDSGFIYSGKTCWPSASAFGMDKSWVRSSTGYRSGLGIAWMLNQIQGRLAGMDDTSIATYDRMGKTIAVALLESALPPHYSPRFDRMLRDRRFGGIISEGGHGLLIHNKLVISSLKVGDSFLKRAPDHPDFDDSSGTNFRFFQCEKPLVGKAGDYLAFEEWFRPRSKEDHYMKVVVFNRETGEEIRDEWATSLQNAWGLKDAVKREFGEGSLETG
jgi:hypothetical protein